MKADKYPVGILGPYSGKNFKNSCCLKNADGANMWNTGATLWFNQQSAAPID
jgi:hypothetical protein